MPTVLRANGFQIRVYPPPREHGPPHVHIVKGDGSVIIELATTDREPRIRSVVSMRDTDIIAALRLVETHRDFLWVQWRTYHG